MVSNSYLSFGGMTWPNPAALEDLEWTLRYGNPSQTDRFIAASVVSAYSELVFMTQLRRADVVRGLRSGTPKQGEADGD